MGRVIVPTGFGSGRIGEKSRNIAGKIRTKRKKRKKDLEKLHRDVHEAKNNLRQRATRETKSTAFSKVLTNFADARQHNDETTHALTWKNGKKKNQRTICDRLLPEPIVGLYKNGAKGRQAYRVDEGMNGTSIARLENNVLKLLDGDETNPKDQDDKRKKNWQQDHLEESAESNVMSQSSKLVIDSPVRDKTKGNKWINRENEKTVVVRKGAEKRNERLEPQRENRCKRRLFEPNDESASDENSFGIIDRSEIMDEICFTPRINIEKSESQDNVKKYLASMENGEINDKLERKFDWRRVPNKFWGWSPETCYERLCAKVCAENFETKQPYTSSDPMTKVRKVLSEMYNISRVNVSSKEKKIGETIKRYKRGATDSRKDSPLQKFSSLSTFVESDDSVAELELERDSPDSCTIKVGSWHADNFPEISSENDGTPDQDTSGRKKNRADNSSGPKARREVNENLGIRRNNRKGRLCEEKPLANGVVRQSINSLFLETLAGTNDSSNGRKTFAEQFAAASQLCSREGKSASNYDESNRSKNDIDVEKNLLRRNKKHIPHILRRSNRRSEILNYIDETFQNIRQKSEKVISGADMRFEDYTNNVTGSNLNKNAKFDEAQFKKTQCEPSESYNIQKENSFLSRVNFFEGKINNIQEVERSKNIEGRTSSAEFADVESFDDTRCTRLTPDQRYVEQVKEPCTCFVQPRGRDIRKVTFDLEQHPFHFQTESELNHPRLELPHPIYLDDPRLDKSTRNFATAVSGKSEIKQKQFKNRHPQGYDEKSLREENLSTDYTPGISFRKRIRKPVVLFKPIRNNVNDRQDFLSHRELHDNTLATVSSAVKNLNVHANSDNFQESSFANELPNISYQNQRHMEGSLSQSLGRTGNDTIHGQILDTQPTKFLAYVHGDGRDPQRIPIYANTDHPQVVTVLPVPVNHPSESAGISVAPIPQFTEIMYVNCPDMKNSNEQLGHHQHQRSISNNVIPTSNKISRNFFNVKNRELLAPCMNYHQDSYLNHRNVNENFCEIESLNRRIQLPDGTTGIFVPDNCGIGTERSYRKEQGIEHREHEKATNHSHQQYHHKKSLASTQHFFHPQYKINTNYNEIYQGNENHSIDPERNCEIKQQSEILNCRGTSSNKIPNIVNMINDQVPTTSIRLKSQYSNNTNYNGSFTDNNCIPNRIILADGTTGIFIPEKRSIETNNNLSTFNR